MRCLSVIFLAILAQNAFPQSYGHYETCTLDMLSIYSFEVGDVFQYNRTHESSPPDGICSNTTTIEKYEIIHKELRNDSIIYQVNGMQLYYCWEYSGFQYFHRTSNINRELIYIDSTNHYLNLCYDTVFIRSYHDYYAIVFEQSDNSIIQKHIGGEGHLFSRDTDSTLVPEIWEMYEVIYRNGCGLVRYNEYNFENSYSKVLEGYVKGYDTTGIITPDEDLIIGTNDYINTQEIIIYPNPANDILILELPDILKEYEIEVFQYKGQKIKTCLVKNNKISIEDLSSGLYIIKINVDHKTLYVSKFIKK